MGAQSWDLARGVLFPGSVKNCSNSYSPHHTPFALPAHAPVSEFSSILARASSPPDTLRNATRVHHLSRKPYSPRTLENTMATLFATPAVVLRSTPRVSRARGRASLRCNAAAKGIVGDGRVKFCVSKDEFDAVNAAAGDKLVRGSPLPPRSDSDTLGTRDRQAGDKNTVSDDFAIFDRLMCFFGDKTDAMLPSISHPPKKQVAVQISTKTCGPCKVVYPHFAGLSEELPDVSFVKIMGDHVRVGLSQIQAHCLMPLSLTV